MIRPVGVKVKAPGNGSPVTTGWAMIPLAFGWIGRAPAGIAPDEIDKIKATPATHARRIMPPSSATPALEGLTLPRHEERCGSDPAAGRAEPVRENPGWRLPPSSRNPGP